VSPVLRVLLKIVYWLAVLAVSVVILIVLILIIESRDKSNVDNGSLHTRASAGLSYPVRSCSATSRANATIRCDAL
jgi:hypothetical protein